MLYDSDLKFSLKIESSYHFIRSFERTGKHSYHSNIFLLNFRHRRTSTFPRITKKKML